MAERVPDPVQQLRWLMRNMPTAAVESYPWNLVAQLCDDYEGCWNSALDAAIEALEALKVD
jgi:hypothetical protein